MTDVNKEGDETSEKGSYVCAHFRGGVPDTNDLHITGDKCFALALLPIKHEACISIAGDQLREGSESCYNLDVLVGFIVAEKLDYTVGRASHEKRLVVFVDVPDLVDL